MEFVPEKISVKGKKKNHKCGSVYTSEWCINKRYGIIFEKTAASQSGASARETAAVLPFLEHSLGVIP